MRQVVAAFAIAILTAACASNVPHCPLSLKLPPGATPATLPSRYLDDQIPTNADRTATKEAPKVYSWACAFSDSQGWDPAVKHFEGIVLAKGYTPIKAATSQLPTFPGHQLEDYAREWISPDHKYIAALVSYRFIRSQGSSNITSTDPEYVFAVDQITDLPPGLQESVSAKYPTLQ